MPPGRGHALLPVHRILLVESGVNIIELLQLEELGAAGHRESLFVMAHLNIAGATGAPLAPSPSPQQADRATGHRRLTA